MLLGYLENCKLSEGYLFARPCTTMRLSTSLFSHTYAANMRRCAGIGAYLCLQCISSSAKAAFAGNAITVAVRFTRVRPVHCQAPVDGIAGVRIAIHLCQSHAATRIRSLGVTGSQCWLINNDRDGVHGLDDSDLFNSNDRSRLNNDSLLDVSIDRYSFPAVQ
jgi:hypothetical protein